MKEILENTYGILVYQEQIMQLAQKLAGYSLGEADLMRRAMGKKKKEEMALHEEKFIDGAVQRGILREKAEKIFSLMAQFADYGFNRSHSFAYAYLAYQTAYLKAHYPAHFFAAVLSNELANSEKLARYIGEMKTFGIHLLPPDINTSQDGFTAVAQAIRFGLAAIKGIGSSAVQMIIQARTDGGTFRSIFDFAERVDQRAVNKRVLESLVKAGAFDQHMPNRAALLLVVDQAIEHGARKQREKASQQIGFAALTNSFSDAELEPVLPDIKPWARKELLAHEKETLGFYASGHPLEDYAESIRSLTATATSNISEQEDGQIVILGGLIVDSTVKITKKGDQFALFRVEDQYGSVKVVCWPETFARHKSLVQNNLAVLVTGKLELTYEGTATIVAQEIKQLESARVGVAKAIYIKLAEDCVNEDQLVLLSSLLGARQGSSPVFFELLTSEKIWVRLRANQFLRVQITPQLIEDINAICKKWQIALE
jgi:DNA polymerase-3 subunit alpha